MTVWFTSDEHYGHANVIKLCKRPFASITEMRDELIWRHNEVVQPGDTVYHLGDMFWRTIPVYEAISILDCLNGNHYYIRGNHEEVMDGSDWRNAELRNRFVWIKERAHIFPDGGPKAGIVLDHYAGRVWNRSNKGSWQLYGHSHGELPEDASLLSRDVGVDTNGYYPISLNQVQSRMSGRIREIVAEENE